MPAWPCLRPFGRLQRLTSGPLAGRGLVLRLLAENGLSEFDTRPTVLPPALQAAGPFCLETGLKGRLAAPHEFTRPIQVAAVCVEIV